jgi:hypothetical protein
MGSSDYGGADRMLFGNQRPWKSGSLLLLKRVLHNRAEDGGFVFITIVLQRAMAA